jgi:sec-independent protein translocase protein TatB
MFNIGTGEMVIILVAALLLLGPERLPELARGIGKFVREFRRQTDDVKGLVEREFYQMDQEIRTATSIEARGLPAPATTAAALPRANLGPVEGGAASTEPAPSVPVLKPPEGAVPVAVSKADKDPEPHAG